jgi:hypothetical protein
LNVKLTKEELTAIDNIAPRGITAGTRYPEHMMGVLNQ